MHQLQPHKRRADGWKGEGKGSCGQADGKIVEQLESSFEGIFKVHATILADSGVKRQTSN